MFARSHDICEAAVNLSANLAKVLYPFLILEPVNACNRVVFWSEFVQWTDVFLSHMVFLQAKVEDINWSYIFLKGTEGQIEQIQVKEAYYSKVPFIHRRLSLAEMQEV